MFPGRGDAAVGMPMPLLLQPLAGRGLDQNFEAKPAVATIGGEPPSPLALGEVAAELEPPELEMDRRRQSPRGLPRPSPIRGGVATSRAISGGLDGGAGVAGAER